MAGKRTRSGSGSQTRAPAAPAPSTTAPTPKPAPRAAKTKTSIVRFRSDHRELRINGPGEPVQFVEGAYETADEQIAAFLTTLAADRPDLLAKEGKKR